MARVAMGDVWDEARAFVTREGALVAPLAFATLGVAFVLLDLVRPEPVGTTLPAGPWMLVLVPVLLLVLFGNLAISILVLVPRSSVAEACRGALVRLGRAVLAVLLAMAALIVVSLGLSIVALAALLVGAGAAGQQLAAVLLLVFAFWLGVRLLPMLPLIAVGNPRGSVAAAVREALLLSRGRTATLVGLLLLYAVMFLLIQLSLSVAFGSLLLLIGRLVGSPTLGETLTTIVSAAVCSLLQAAWTVFVAVLTRRLMAAREA